MIQRTQELVRIKERPQGACGSSRLGTAIITQEEMRKRWGTPHIEKTEDDKVECLFYIETPRGFATIYQYWWSEEPIKSIGACNSKTVLWVRRWLKEQGIETKRGR